MLCALIIASPPGVVSLREVVVDLEQRRMPRERASAPVTIVEIDERSLALHGQWPWPRSQVAALVERIGAAGPAAIGLDLLFPEPDRYSPALLAGMEETRPSGEPPLLQFETSLSSIKPLAEAAAGRGLISAESPARIVRRVPVVARVEGDVMPSLGIEMLRVATGAPAVSIGPPGAGLLEVQFAGVRIPAQADGTAWIRYTRHDPGRFVSAAAVLDGSADPELLKQKLVLVAVTGLALVDHLATPLGERVPGVEMHAQLIEQVFDDVYIVRPGWASWAEAGFLAAAAAILIVVVPTRRVRISVAALAGLLAFLVALAIVAFRSGLLLDFAWPAIGVLLGFAMLVAAALSEADRQRRALREAAARAAGELAAARRIQMGLLPDLPSVAQSLPSLEVAGVIEPARTVGGDFYDCVALDARRVYFLLGDVTGKGMPAALFMALSKAVLKSAAARGLDPGALLTHASAEIDRDNSEQLFVTAFAGILDLQTGELEYSNAGHEPPFLLPAGDAPQRLPHAGGPPLCTLKGFSYPKETISLKNGSCLCVVSDGITEAMNEQSELYGAARLEEVLKNSVANAPAAVVAALRDDVARFAGNAPLSDDVTLLALRWGASGR